MRRRPRSLLFLALALAALVPACDDSGIKQVERRSFMSANDLLALEQTSGVFVEIHGAPWEGATIEEIAGTLRMPQGPARGIRFRPIPPGQGFIGEGRRLVLHFNPVGSPNSDADCRATSPLETAPPPKGQFSVNVSFCKASEWQIRGFMRVSADAGDWLAYYQSMERLLERMFVRR